MTFHLACWNLIISGFGTLCLILITWTSKHQVENPSFSSIEARFAGLTLLALTSPLALDVAANLITERMSGFKDGLLIGRVLYVIVTFFFGLQITLQYDIWYVFSNFESSIIFSLRCYRIIGYSIINYFVSITDTVGGSNYQVIFLTTSVSLLTCYNALYPSSYVTDLHLLMILKLFKFIFLIRTNYDFWISRNNATFNYSHLLYVNMIFVAFLCEYAIRFLANICLSRSNNAINVDPLLVPIYSWAIITTILTVIPGWISRRDPVTFKDQIMATKASFQRYIAHEMRSPLNSTFMGIDFCINSIPINSIFSELRNIREVLMEVKKSSQDALLIADDMLIQDKLENGNFSIHKEALNIKNFILDYLSTFQVEIRSKNINFEIINCDVDMTNLLNFQQDEITLQNDQSNNDNSDGDSDSEDANNNNNATKKLFSELEENAYTKRLAYVFKRQTSGKCSVSNNPLGFFINQSVSSKTLGNVQESSLSKKFEDSFQSVSSQTLKNSFQNSKPIKTLENTFQQSVSCKMLGNTLQENTPPNLSSNRIITESQDISSSKNSNPSQKRTSIQRLFNDFQENTPSDQVINNLQENTPPSLSSTNRSITESQDISLSSRSDPSQKRTSIQRLFNDFQENTPSDQVINNLQENTPPSLSSTNRLITESQDISLSSRSDPSQKRTSIQRLFNDFQESTPSDQVINNLQENTPPSLSSTNRLITESQDFSLSSRSDPSQKRTSIQRLFNDFQENTPSDQVINNLQENTPPSLSSTNRFITEFQDFSLSSRSDPSQKRTSIQRLFNDFQENTPSDQVINNLQENTPPSLSSTNMLITESQGFSLSSRSDPSQKRTSIQRLFNDFQENTPSDQVINNLQENTPPSLSSTNRLITESQDISLSSRSDPSQKRTSIQRLFNDFQENTPSDQVINNLQENTPPSLSSTNRLITESQDISLSSRSDPSQKRTSIQRLFNDFQENISCKNILNDIPTTVFTERKKHASYEKLHFLNETAFIESITTSTNENTADSNIFSKSDKESSISSKGTYPTPLSARRGSLGISNTSTSPAPLSARRGSLGISNTSTRTNPTPVSARKGSLGSQGLRRLSKQMSFRRLSCKPSNGYEFVEDTDTIFVDKSRFGQVLRNLMSNAIKFTPDDGSIKLCIRFEPDSNTTSTDLKRKGMLVFEIKDSGPGISLENQTLLFNEIIQFNPEKLQAGGGGSGLGLWISKKIVDMHDGRLTVYSDGEGKGTTFRIEIPMTRNTDVNSNILSRPLITPTDSRRSSCFSDSLDMSDPGTESDNLPISTPLAFRHRFDLNKPVLYVQAFQSSIVQIITEPTDLSQVNPIPKNRISNSTRKKILLVDDIPSCRKMLRKLLEQRGHVCDEAEDGIDAINSVKATANINMNGYDAILMDYIMKSMHGPDATRAIRNLGYIGPIIGVTGNALNEDQEIFMNAGATDVIIKPLKISRLKEIIIDI